MIVVRLIVSIPGLGAEGDRVVVDPELAFSEGDWVLVETDDMLRFQPYTLGLPNLGSVAGVVPSDDAKAAKSFTMLTSMIRGLTKNSYTASSATG